MQRKIIHVDMDCFYAAIEVRDNPELAEHPVAVGGSADGRGVLCTANYIARQYGVRSAMPTATALRLCPKLVLLPVNFDKYRAVAANVQAIFRSYTDLVEPLSLDEAYLDVSAAQHYHGSATLIAQAIRRDIWEAEHLIASAGVAPNKFLAKIASGWHKPNALFVIQPNEIAAFVKDLPVKELFGVGKVTAEKMQQLGFQTCSDLQQKSLWELKKTFGKFGQQLYEQCRGIDHREVQPDRERKSLSVENTFSQDKATIADCKQALQEIYTELLQRLDRKDLKKRVIKNQFVKVKFHNFKLVTAEIAVANKIDFQLYEHLFSQLYARENIPVRLLGLGVSFKSQDEFMSRQYSLFGEEKLS